MHRPRIAALVLVVAACGEPGPTFVPGRCINLPRPPSRDLVRLERALPGLAFEAGVDLQQSPVDPARWYLVRQDGVITTHDGDASSTFVDVAGLIEQGGEAGLLGMAFHPDFAGNGQVFLSYTAPGSPLTSTIARYTSPDGGRTLDPASAEVVLTVDQPYTNHNGGDIAFGPDGFLYFGLGDGGSSGDPQGNAQDPGTLLGKILRVDVDAAAPYGIPQDNPYADGVGGRPEIFAGGFRNPWRFNFDRETGDLWAGDVGQNTWEEVDRVELGKNYGWDIKEGPDCFEQDVCADAELVDPVAAYRNISVASVIAGTVYRGRAVPEIAGMFVYGDFYSGTIYGVRDGEEPVILAETGERGLSAFAEDRDGELHVVNYYGTIHRLAAAEPDTGPGLPADLFETGCLDPADPARPPQDAIPYELNVPFWSDGADKQRWLVLPDDQQITVEADGDWTLPPGSVLVKNFKLGDRLIETRLLVRHSDGEWAGYSYAWSDDATSAALLDDALIKNFGDQSWTYPSRTDCKYCHTAEAGRSLGLETRQLARTVRDAAGADVDQLDLLVELGALASRPAGDPLPDTAGGAPLEPRARAYFHANCSHCHRPDAPGGRADIDLRFDTPLAEVKICDVNPRAGDLDIAGARLVAPGDPARSIVSARMHTLGSTRMPGLASSVVDADGVALVDAWIAGLGACP